MTESRDRRLADRALAAQYALADIQEGNPWVDMVGSVLYAGGQKEGQRLTAATKRIASEASTFVVSTDMTEVVKQAAEDLMFLWMQEGEVPDVILPYDLPHPQGFVLFSHSINLGHFLDDYEDEVR
ncbi:MAG TPA: hypothetical protein VFT30_10145, partial [Nitrospira sp.]|nr:hypothetical protein [Nitrospira sp.]